MGIYFYSPFVVMVAEEIEMEDFINKKEIEFSNITVNDKNVENKHQYNY
jgi:hypothetical protein